MAKEACNVNYFGLTYLTQTLMDKNLINPKKGRIINLGTINAQFAFKGCNQVLKSKLLQIVENGSIEDLDDIMSSYLLSMKQSKPKQSPTFKDYQFPSDSYGMSKVEFG